MCVAVDSYIKTCYILFLSFSDFGTFLHTGLKTAFLVTVSVFTLQFLISKIAKAFYSKGDKEQTQLDGGMTISYIFLFFITCQKCL